MKSRFIYTSIILLSLLSCYAQPFSIGHTTIDFIDTTRNNRVVATEIYYPASTAGDNVSVVANAQTFPVISFGHGFVMTWDAYQNIWNALVPNGYIMAFPKTEGSISPSHADFGRDLAFVVQQMTLLNTTTNSIFYNRVSNYSAVMGHSMGGGASFLAVNYNPNITAIVNLAAAETSPSAIQACSLITIPSLVFAGANDCVTPPATNQVLMYNALNSSCKTMVTITGGSHCQMANSNFFCTVGESSCTPAPTITRAQQHTMISTLLLPWLDYQLKSNCDQGALFDTLVTTQSGITYQKNCIQCNPLNIAEETSNDIKVYPNPASTKIVIKANPQSRYVFILLDMQSKKIKEQAIVSSETIDISNLSKGVYIYQLLENNIVVKTDKIIIN